MRAGRALLIDIRSEVERERDCIVPGSCHVARNVSESRCVPSSDWHDSEITDQLDRQLIVIYNEDYRSSLAAATLQRFAFTDATDVIGGFQGGIRGTPSAPAASRPANADIRLANDRVTRHIPGKGSRLGTVVRPQLRTRLHTPARNNSRADELRA
jgi:rhodanese-related sulfurtransferase